MASTPQDPSDHARWSTSENLSQSWDERAKIATEWIPAQAKVADIGCGNMAVEKFLRDSVYIPVDLYPRDERTTVCNLNVEVLPESIVERADHATLLGVIEYLLEPKQLLSRLANAGITVVCTYQLADFTGREERDRNGWFNHLRAIDMLEFFADCGFTVEKSRRFDSQGIYLLVPANPKVARPVTASRKTSDKPTVILSGFFGRGNAGDEAILQVQYEKLSPHFNIAISTDERGAHDGFWNWYPYNQCQLIHQAEIAIFGREDVVGLHIGGGDLPLGFNGGQMIAALSHGKKVIVSGVDCKWVSPDGHGGSSKLVKNFLDLAPTAFRSKGQFEQAHGLSDNATWGADWALDLETDCDPDSPRDLVLLTLEEFPIERIDHDTLVATRNLVSALQDRNWEVALMPFCPEDERFMGHLAPTFGLRREVHWWNPRRLKQLIKQAKLVVSVGRFHPLVFGASTETPCLYAEWGTNKGKRIDKALALCEEVNFRYFPRIGELNDFLLRGEQIPVPRMFSSDYHNRFKKMVNQVIDGFKTRPTTGQSESERGNSFWSFGRRSA